jgi:hypothetical protein
MEPVAELTQVRLLERLQVDTAATAVEAVAAQRLHDLLLERETDRVEVRRVLGLRRDPDRPAVLPALALGQIDDLLEGRYLVAAVVDGALLADRGQSLLGAQRLELGKVKSSVNQPVIETPSIVLVALRSANSGWSATSVVPPISFSCRATRTPSFVETRSGSITSAPIRIARS